jgi:NAD+ kinase
MKKGFQKASIYSSSGLKRVEKIAHQIIEILENIGIEVFLTDSLAEMEVKKKYFKSDSFILKNTDILISIGGDGSLLSSARRYGNDGIPILGINLGNLGFLTDIKPEDLTVSLVDVFKGKCTIEERFFLESSIGKSNKKNIALNELVIHSGSVAQLMEYEMYIDDNFVFRQKADGLIISTPTGSTAYSLSGGGPILHPNVDAISIVPMFPHSLSSSPLVINKNCKIRIEILRGNRAMLSFDSHDSLSLSKGNTIHVTKAKSPLNLIHPLDHNFYSACRNKLGWSMNIS